MRILYPTLPALLHGFLAYHLSRDLRVAFCVAISVALLGVAAYLGKLQAFKTRQ